MEETVGGLVQAQAPLESLPHPYPMLYLLPHGLPKYLWAFSIAHPVTIAHLVLKICRTQEAGVENATLLGITGPHGTI